jgi:hypothetical protein
MWLLGKTLFAAAAVTVMAAFPRDRRWLTSDTTLLIHGRRMMRNVHLEGPLGSCRRVLEEIIADIDNGLRVENEGFAQTTDIVRRLEPPPNRNGAHPRARCRSASVSDSGPQTHIHACISQKSTGIEDVLLGSGNATA